MNIKNQKDVKGRPITIRLTESESNMAKELRAFYNINISNLIRNTIRKEYEKVLQRN